MKQGLNYVIHSSLTKTVILTDSQSPQLIQNTKTLNNKQITYAIEKQIYILATQKQTIMIPWIPSQKNIRGNEINNPMPVSQDLKYPIQEIKLKNFTQWEQNLKSILLTKDYLIKDNSIKPWIRARRRKLDSCITRILTKHTRIKHHHRLKMENDPTCRWRKNPEETIKHMIKQWPRFNSQRGKRTSSLSS